MSIKIVSIARLINALILIVLSVNRDFMPLTENAQLNAQRKITMQTKLLAFVMCALITALYVLIVHIVLNA